jgi:hypothetical protein
MNSNVTLLMNRFVIRSMNKFATLYKNNSVAL